MNGASSAEQETYSKPASSKKALSACSCTGLRKECISATAAPRTPSRTSRAATGASCAVSSRCSTLPSAASRSGTSTTLAYSGSGFWMRSANRSGRCCVPMRSKSRKPRVMNSATGAPLRSSRALVARVVARRMASGGRGASAGVPVTRRAARMGASSGEATSNEVPGVTCSGSGPASSMIRCAGS